MYCVLLSSLGAILVLTSDPFSTYCTYEMAVIFSENIFCLHFGPGEVSTMGHASRVGVHNLLPHFHKIKNGVMAAGNRSVKVCSKR